MSQEVYLDHEKGAFIEIKGYKHLRQEREDIIDVIKVFTGNCRDQNDVVTVDQEALKAESPQDDVKCAMKGCRTVLLSEWHSLVSVRTDVRSKAGFIASPRGDGYITISTVCTEHSEN